ncbi:MAG: D-alanyl-D-alanine carboxypeptidase, partial [Prevotellaceae bacterium]|nr:D-alanyl-D-alanine carboxypeptidase [Prevotellaceae bacterium]
MSINIFAQNPIEEFIYNPLLQNANISFLVSDVRTGEVVCEHRACNMAVPASTMKVITTATALELLGADFRFRTLLEMDEKPTADSVLNGNIIIRGTGDPTLGSAFFPPADFLNNWVLAVKNAGIKTIRGQIIVDEQKFETEGVNPHWLWEDIGNYYAAGI